jgi:hypothetical protein
MATLKVNLGSIEFETIVAALDQFVANSDPLASDGLYPEMLTQRKAAEEMLDLLNEERDSIC